MILNRVKPFAEVRIRWDKGQAKLITPWMTIPFGVHPEKADDLIFAASLLNLGLAESAWQDVEWLIRGFTNYPVFSFAPRLLSQFEAPDQTNKPEHFREMQHTIDAMSLRIPHFKPVWKLEEILDQSRIPGYSKYDPLCVASTIRRLRILDQMTHGQDRALIETLGRIKREEDEQIFLKCCALLVQQNYYVTSECHEAIRGAMEFFPAGSVGHEEIKNFIDSEVGHDELLKASFEELSDPAAGANEVPVLTETKMRVQLLKESSRKSLIAFSLLVDSFERSGIDSKHPFEDLLNDSKVGAKAMKGLRAHQNVNDSLGHGNVCFSFLTGARPLARVEVGQALICAELDSYLHRRLTDRLLDSIKSIVTVTS